MNFRYNTWILLVAFAALFALNACVKINEEVPETLFVEDDAIRTPQDVQNLLNSCYDALANALNGKSQSFSDLMSDDLVLNISDAGNKAEIYNRSTIIFNDDTRKLYADMYIISMRVNNLERFYDKVGVSESERIRISAEGRFLRALCHWEVAKLWAQPPGFTTDNSHLGAVIRNEASTLPKGRSTVQETYDFIISDLQYAIGNLPVSNGNYATKSAAQALLAKVYFMLNRGDLALPLINEVINTSGKVLSTSVNRFNNAVSQSEYIFTTISTGQNDNRSAEFVGQYRCDTKTPNYTLTRQLYLALTTDTLDKRGKNLVQVFNAGNSNEYYGATKFNQDYFSVPILHLTDMHLLRAEILAEQGTNLTTAIDDVNLIIKRAYSDSLTRTLPSNAPQSQVLAEVRKQRRLEMFCEGDRLQALKRRGAFFEPALTIRNAPWNCPGMVLQFHAREGGQNFVFNPSGGCN